LTVEQYQRQHDIKKDGCFGGMFRDKYLCDGAICRSSCDALKEHRYTMRKKVRLVSGE